MRRLGSIMLKALRAICYLAILYSIVLGLLMLHLCFVRLASITEKTLKILFQLLEDLLGVPIP